MPNRSNSSATTAGVVVFFLLIGFACRGHAIAYQQVSQERSLEAQLRELSTLVSKSSGIEQHFEYRVSEADGSMTIINNSPENFIHMFRLTNWKRSVIEMDLVEIRELRRGEFLLDYQPSDAPAVRIPNLIEDPGRYALVAIRTVRMDPKPLTDLTDLAPIAEQPLTPRGVIRFDAGQPTYYPKRRWADYKGLTVSIIDRQSLRDESGNLRFEGSSPTSRFCLDIEVSGYGVAIRYGEISSDPALRGCAASIRYGDLSAHCPVLTPYLSRRFTRAELLRRVYKKPVAHHDYTSTYRGRVRWINRLFGGRKFIDFTLYFQTLGFSDGVWRVGQQDYFSAQGDVQFVTMDNKLVILEQ